MRLAIIITSLEVGGAEKMVLDLISQIKGDIQVKLFIIRRNYQTIYDVQANELNIDIKYINNKTKIISLFTFLKIKSELDKYKPMIIHTHLKSSSYIYFYSFFNKGFKWIHTVHTHARIDTKFLRRILFKSLYENKKIKLVAVSETVKKSILELYNGTDISVVCNGINLSMFSITKHIGDEMNICHVGRFVPVKNHEYLIYEFEKLINDRPYVKLILVGDGPLKNKMINLVKKLNLCKNVIFVGYTNNVSYYLRQSKIFVLPSIYEGLSLSMLEALASGLIVIAGSGGQDVIEDAVDGFLIKLEKNQLYNKLLFIIDHIDSMERLQNQARIKSKEFSIEKMAMKYINLYNEEANG